MRETKYADLVDFVFAVLGLSCTAIGLEMWAIAATVKIMKQQMSIFPYGPALEYDSRLR